MEARDGKKSRQAAAQLSGSPLPGTGWHMMPWPACAFVCAVSEPEAEHKTQSV